MKSPSYEERYRDLMPLVISPQIVYQRFHEIHNKNNDSIKRETTSCTRDDSFRHVSNKFNLDSRDMNKPNARKIHIQCWVVLSSSRSPDTILKGRCPWKIPGEPLFRSAVPCPWEYWGEGEYYPAWICHWLIRLFD